MAIAMYGAEPSLTLRCWAMASMYVTDGAEVVVDDMRLEVLPLTPHILRCCWCCSMCCSRFLRANTT